jgi:hypothetical protein
LTNVVVIEEWLQGGIIQQFTNNQAMLLTVLIMTLFAGLTADLVTEE